MKDDRTPDDIRYTLNGTYDALCSAIKRLEQYDYGTPQHRLEYPALIGLVNLIEQLKDDLSATSAHQEGEKNA